MRLLISTIAAIAASIFTFTISTSSAVSSPSPTVITVEATTSTLVPLAEPEETTTTSSTTTTSTTTTTTVVYPAEVVGPEWNCPDAVVVAYEVGWPIDQLPKLDRIMFRESRCDTHAHNTEDPAGGSRGLTQINGFWCRTSHWLQDQGILDSCDDLFIPEVSLTASLAIWNRSGWNPWGG